jgi:tetratricopeptide (TPR) repeat protein
MRIFLLSICVCLILLPTTSWAQKVTPANKATPAKKRPTQPQKNTSAKPKTGTSAASKPKSTDPAGKNVRTANKSKSTQTATKKPARPVKKPEPDVAQPDERSEFAKAATTAGNTEKIEALKRFISGYPDSGSIDQARELLSNTAFSLAQERLAESDVERAVEYFKLAIESAPKPVPDDLFNNYLSRVPGLLFWRGNRAPALEIGRMLESKIDTSPTQLIDLATFHISIENGDDAVRLSELALKAGPPTARAYETLGLANRVNFRLDDAAVAYAKALELDQTSISVRRSLADIKRAVGKPDEAIALYREAIAADPADQQSKNGLILSLFDSNKKEEAEKELAAALIETPRNVMLMAGAAYWYAAHKNNDRAAELAQQAIAVEPRYVWSYIALARARMLQNRPLDAEETLLRARMYGNFATLEYELATARSSAGFYREAVEGLEHSFSISGDTVRTLIGGRVERTGASFAEIVADERRASIFEPTAAYDPETDRRLRQLLILNGAISTSKPETALVSKAVDAFVAGDDNYKIYRQLYAASLLLNNKIAVEKALELAEAAIGNSDAAVSIPNAAAAVMASELYESRQTALRRNELVQVPNVPRTTLSTIMRGRIEELVGWALFDQGKAGDAAIRFRRGAAILPEKSAWWRSVMWRLGLALEADGKEQEALDAYIKSYSIDKPDAGRYTRIEALYKKLNGTTEGLEAKIGKNPIPELSSVVVAKNTETPPAIPTPQPAESLVSTPTPVAEPVASPTAEPTVSATPSPEPVSSPAPATEPTPSPTSTPEPRPNETPVEPTAKPTPETATPSSAEKPLPVPEQTLTPVVDPKPDAAPMPSPSAEASPTPIQQDASTIKVEPTTISHANAAPGPSPRPRETPSESAVAKAIGDKPEARGQTPVERASKPLFEPIIITVPKPEMREAKSNGPPGSESTLKDPVGNDGRPRLIDGKPIQTTAPEPCTISVSQNRLSLVNNVGLQSILVGVDKNGELEAVKAYTSSPEDLAVVAEPYVTGIEGRMLYSIRSLSEKTGVFQVIFQLPCGKKEIAVIVR